MGFVGWVLYPPCGGWSARRPRANCDATRRTRSPWRSSGGWQWRATMRGRGADILADALPRIAAAAPSIGIAAMPVQAKHDRARAFCLACAELVEFPAESWVLFLAMEPVGGWVRATRPGTQITRKTRS